MRIVHGWPLLALGSIAHAAIPARIIDLKLTGPEAPNLRLVGTPSLGIDTVAIVAEDGDTVPGTGGRRAILGGSLNSLQLLAFEGTDTSAFPGEPILSLSNPWVSQTGNVLFNARLGGPTDYASPGAIYFGKPNDLRAMAVTGRTPVGSNDSLNVGAMNGVSLALAGDYFTFRSSLSRSAFNDGEALWLGSPDRVNVLVRKGLEAPGTLGGTFDSVRYSRVNNFGMVAFDGVLRVGSGDVEWNNDWGVWAGTPGNLSLIVREGAPVAGFAEGFTYLRPDVAGIDDHGVVIFQSDTRENGLDGPTGLWSAHNGQAKLLLRTGDSVPGASDIRIETIYRPLVGRSGLQLVEVSLNGPDVGAANDESIWIRDHLGFIPVFREGDAAPGFPSGSVLGRPSGTAVNLPGLALISTEVLASDGSFLGGALYVAGRDGLNLFLSRDTELEFGPGDIRRLEYFRGLNTDLSSVYGKAVLNDQGQVLLRGLDDPYYGPGRYVLVTVPEPGSLILLITALTVRRRR